MSARSPIARSELPRRIVPTTPVLASPRCTSQPNSASFRATRSAVRSSSKPSSGWAWMSRRISGQLVEMVAYLGDDRHGGLQHWLTPAYRFRTGAATRGATTGFGADRRVRCDACSPAFAGVNPSRAQLRLKPRSPAPPSPSPGRSFCRPGCIGRSSWSSSPARRSGWRSWPAPAQPDTDSITSPRGG